MNNGHANLDLAIEAVREWTRETRNQGNGDDGHRNPDIMKDK